MKLLARLFPGRSSPASVSEVSRVVASGLSPAIPNVTAGALPPQPAAPERAQIMARDGRAALVAVLAEKVLHGWLQNQHQTLFPLTINFRSLAAPQRETLMQMMAVALLATHAAADEARQGPLRKWLAAAGADDATVQTLAAELSIPPALNQVIADIIERDVAAYAYVVALMALDPRDLAAIHFLEYVAARLGLPNTVVQSAKRRYRR